MDTKALQATLIARVHARLAADHEAGLHTELAKRGGGLGSQRACCLCTSPAPEGYDVLERLDHKPDDFIDMNQDDAEGQGRR